MKRANNKGARLEVRTTPAETTMLSDLAAIRGVKASEVVRSLIRDAYRSQFPMKNAGASIASTPRAILEAVTRVSHPEHLTVKNLAAMADVSPSAVEGIFRRLERTGFFERVTTHAGGDHTFQSWVPLEDLLNDAEKKGVRLDTPIEGNALSLDVFVRDHAKGIVGVGPIGAASERLMPSIVEELRAACRKVGAKHHGQKVTMTEIARELSAVLAPTLGRGIDAYASPGSGNEVQLSGFHVEA